MLLAADSLEVGVQLVQALADDVGITDDVHIIGIPVPAGHDVNMQVFGHACTGAPAEIHAHIETVRCDGSGQDFLAFADEFGQFEKFIFGGAFKIGYVPQRCDQQMPVIIWKLVEDHHTPLGAPEHKIFGILVGILPVIAEKTSGFFTEPFDVFDPPGRP